MSASLKLSRATVLATPYPETAPPIYGLLGEARAALDIATVPLSLSQSLLTRKPKSQTDQKFLPVVMFPGFASDQRYLKPLEIYLRNNGFYTEDWGQGFNVAGMNLSHTLEDLSESWEVEPYEGYDPEDYRGEAGVPFLCDRARDHVRERAQHWGSPVALVGWSLGGYIAREVARDLTDDVAHVVTFGTPIIGGPKYTRAAKAFLKKGLNLNWIESETKKRDAKPIQQPITAIVSKSDGVVNWQAAIDKVSPNVEHIEVDVAHLGMGFNRQVWRLTERSLRTHANKPESS